jgi:hypothetical protein
MKDNLQKTFFGQTFHKNNMVNSVCPVEVHVFWCAAWLPQLREDRRGDAPGL